MQWQIFMYTVSETNFTRGIWLSILPVFLTVAVVLTTPVQTSAQATPGTCSNPSDPANGFMIGADGNPTTVACTVPGTTLSNDGIFGCQGLGAQIQNVGTRAAVGGVYVPVNDAAVTLNTGFLVYKECILDGTARKIAENVSAGYVETQLRAAAEGRNGSPQFVTNELEELRRQGNIIFINSLGESNIGVMCPAFRTSVRGSSARAYVQRINRPNERFACTLPTNSNASFYEILAALLEPANNPYGAQIILDDQIRRTLAYNENNQRERWIRSNGVYDQVDDIENPLGGHIVTPGYLIAQSIAQVTGSGFRQLESANEIDQVVANLFGGLTTQLVSDTRGLTGLTQPVNGQQSYLDRMTTQTSASVRQQAANAALTIISAARQIETNYRQAKEGTATNLTNAIVRLRAAENQCWTLIIPAVQTYAQTNGSPTLNTATSTQFSQPIIDSQIAPLATTTINEIRASDTSIGLLNQLVASVSNSASQANQQQALLRLDTMVANRQLRTTADANNAVQQRDSVATALTKLVDDTIKAWGDSTDPNVGWCNVNNPDVVTRWFDAWKQ